MDEQTLTGPQHFTYHRGIAPMLWVLIGLSSIELITVHVLLAFWNGLVAAVTSILTGAVIVWLVHVVRSMRRLPVVLTGERLILRVGTLRSFDVDRSNVAGLRMSWSSRAERGKSVANLALIAYPNVFIDLKAPIAGSRLGRPTLITSIAHRMDDLPGFVAAIEHGRIQ